MLQEYFRNTRKRNDREHADVASRRRTMAARKSNKLADYEIARPNVWVIENDQADEVADLTNT